MLTAICPPFAERGASFGCFLQQWRKSLNRTLTLIERLLSAGVVCTRSQCHNSFATFMTFLEHSGCIPLIPFRGPLCNRSAGQRQRIAHHDCVTFYVLRLKWNALLSLNFNCHVRIHCWDHVESAVATTGGKHFNCYEYFYRVLFLLSKIWLPTENATADCSCILISVWNRKRYRLVLVLIENMQI